MRGEIDFDNLFISAPYGSGDIYESVEDFESYFPCIRELEISFAIGSESGEQLISFNGKKQRANRVGLLSGTLVLGRQAFREGESFVVLCDDYSADLCVAATELKNAGVLDDPFGDCYDVLFIRSLELSQELVDATNLHEFFDRIPRFVFQHEGVMPQVCCNLVADFEGYYEKQEKWTEHDSRSASKDSVRIFTENGYWLTKSGKLLVRLYDEDANEIEEVEHDLDDDDIDFADEFINQQSLNFASNEVKAELAAADRHILEDHVSVGFGIGMVYIPRDAPSDLIRYVRAAIVAYNLGTTFDHALDHFLSEDCSDVSAIHLAFQEMYYAGMEHIDNTQQRMNPQVEASAGEVFSDAALSRAKNTYYVAALLYREGHMIEAHAMSRLMLEQIAWSFSVCKKRNREEAEKESPTKAIGKLKKKIGPVGKLYGMLSQYVHLPLKGHDEFIDLSHGESSVLMQFGAHSYYFGQILAYLADYWADVYEYTQARHFEQLENWKEEPSGLVLSSNRPFLKIIEPFLENLRSVYAEQYPAYEDFLKNNWTIESEDEGESVICNS